MRYEFRKLYADLVTRDGAVCVLYLTELVLLGKRRSHAGIELYWPDGRSEVLQAQNSGGLPTEARRQLTLNLGGGRFVYELDVDSDQSAPASVPSASMSWSIQLARSRVTARWLDEPHRPTLSGTGYADRVILTRPPRSLGLESLNWGRIHALENTVVFNLLHFADGSRWTRLIAWSPLGPPTQYDSVDFECANGSTRIDCPGHTIEIEPRRVLHGGPAISTERFPRLLERQLTRAVAGPIQETRWLGRARICSSASEDAGPAVYEQVHFGDKNR